MILACVAKCWSHAWIIGIFFRQERPTQEELHGLCFFTPIWFWLVRLFCQWQQSTRKPYTWFWLVWPNAGLLHKLLVHFLAKKGQHKNSYVDVLVFLPLYDSGLCVCSTSDSNVQESLYMALACVDKCRSSAWIIVTFSGQERPTQEQLHERSRLFTSIWFWLVRLFYQWQLCIKTAYTWFWLVWPNGGLMHELLVHFLARKGQHNKSYMSVLVFLPLYDSGLCACSTSDSYI